MSFTHIPSLCAIVLLVLATISAETFQEMFKRGHKEMEERVEKEHGHLREKDEEAYQNKVNEANGRFIFGHMDKDKNGMLDREELINFGKLTFSDDVEASEIWADMTMESDKDKDKRLTFEEFYQPKVIHGQRSEDIDARHLHKEEL